MIETGYQVGIRTLGVGLLVATSVTLLATAWIYSKFDP